jgi:hypothetical protein
MRQTAEQTAEHRNRVFVDGYLSGERGELQSAREVSTLYPTLAAWEVETYLAGQDDGRSGDRWRLKNMGATLPPRRADHCTHPQQTWCDCDWCRLNHHWTEAR